MAINSRDKGAVGERELAAFLREQGYVEARRGLQFKGGPESPDAVGLPGFHIEVKRTERFSLYDAVNQAHRDAAGLTIPVVAHRCNSTRKTGDVARGAWLWVLQSPGFLDLIAKAGYGPPPVSLEDLI